MSRSPVTSQIQWTDENVATLKTMWAEGYSARTIANVLGGTRNAVLGKVHRLKLAARTPSGGKAEKPRPKRQRLYTPRPVAPAELPPQPKPEPFKAAIAETALPSRDMELTALTEGDCKYPTTSVGRHHLFCGNPTKPHSSYCPAHHLVACPPAIQPKPRQRRAYAVGRFEMAGVGR